MKMKYYVNLNEILKEWKYTPNIVVERLNRVGETTIFIDRYDSDYDVGKLFWLAGKAGVSMSKFKLVRFDRRRYDK